MSSLKLFTNEEIEDNNKSFEIKKPDNNIYINCDEIRNISIQKNMSVITMCSTHFDLYENVRKNIYKYIVTDEEKKIKFYFEGEGLEKSICYNKNNPTDHKTNSNLGICCLGLNDLDDLLYITSKYLFFGAQMFYFDNNIYLIIQPADKYINKIFIRITNFSSYTTKT